MIYRLDGLEIDTGTFELRQDGHAVHVEPLVFELIRYLAENPERLLTRDEIIDQVWQGRIVSDATVAGCIKSARRALGAHSDCIRTVRGRGFRFVGAVEPAASPPATAATAAADLMPKLFVLPFVTIGAEPALAQALTRDLATVLTRIPLLAISSRGDAAPPAADGITYLLEGSLERRDEEVHATIQLSEARGGFNLWARSFDVAAGPQAARELLTAILPRLEVQLVRAIFNDLKTGTGELGSRQLLIQAMSLLALQGWTEASFLEAAELLRRSIRSEPGFALAHAYLALVLGLGHRVGLLKDREQVAAAAREEAERALALDSLDSNVLGIAGCALADIGLVDRALPALEQSIDIHPGNAQAWTALGTARMMQAIRRLRSPA